MHFSLRSIAGFSELAEDNNEIVKFLFTPIRPWEENMLTAAEPVPVVGFQRPDILKTIRYLKT